MFVPSNHFLEVPGFDYVLNIANNPLPGGTALEHLELRRKDKAYLNALGVERIPDPTTTGDFWAC